MLTCMSSRAATTSESGREDGELQRGKQKGRAVNGNINIQADAQLNGSTHGRAHDGKVGGVRLDRRRIDRVDLLV